RRHRRLRLRRRGEPREPRPGPHGPGGVSFPRRRHGELALDVVSERRRALAGGDRVRSRGGALTDDAEDRRLVARFLDARDEASFRALYRRHAAAVYGLALRLCGGRAAQAEDVAQESWVRAMRGLGGFRWGSRLGSWLCGIAVNVWRESCREGVA